MYLLIQNRSFTIIFYVMLVRTKFWGFQFPKCLQCLACFEAKFEARRGSVECQVCIISGFSMCSKAFRQTVETTRSRPLSIQAYVGETRPKIRRRCFLTARRSRIGAVLGIEIDHILYTAE